MERVNSNISSSFSIINNKNNNILQDKRYFNLNLLNRGRFLTFFWYHSLDNAHFCPCVCL